MNVRRKEKMPAFKSLKALLKSGPYLFAHSPLCRDLGVKCTNELINVVIGSSTNNLK